MLTTKANFTSEEWGKLLASPMIAGMAMIPADPSGLWGLLKETIARRLGSSRSAPEQSGESTRESSCGGLLQRLKGVLPRERRSMQDSRAPSLTGSKTRPSPN